MSRKWYRTLVRIRTIVFDFDDTLVETGDLFREILGNLCDLLVRRLDGSAPAREEILRRQEVIDIRLLGRTGIKPERFSASLVETYQEVLAEGKVPRDEKEEAYLWDEGLRAFRDIPRLSEDTAKVLAALAAREKLIYTWGLDSIQRPRILAHGLERHFAEIHCVEKKSPEALAKVLGARDPRATMIVGDSLKGEIAPAVALGCHAVHLARTDGWTFLHAEVEGEFHKIDRLGELLSLLDRLEGTVVHARE